MQEILEGIIAAATVLEAIKATFKFVKSLIPATKPKRKKTKRKP